MLLSTSGTTPYLPYILRTDFVMPSAASTPLKYCSLRNTPFQGLYLICANNLQSSSLSIQQLKHNGGNPQWMSMLLEGAVQSQ